MRQAVALLLSLALLMGCALAADDDALGLYTPLDEAQQTELDTAAGAIVTELLLPDMSDGEKALALHDWLVLHCRYDTGKYRDMAYGAVVEGKAICRGYARGFALLAAQAGLDSVYTFSVALAHAWTLTRLDGHYYGIDPTWDDDHYERIGFVNHRHCMFSDATGRAQNHYGEDTDIKADGGVYEDAPWQEAVTRVIFDGDYMYFIDRALRLVRCERSSWACETLYTIDAVWPDFFEDYDGSPAPATGLELLDGCFWFNTPDSVISLAMDGSDPCVEYSADGEGAYLCGLVQRGGKLIVSLSQTKHNVGYTLRTIRLCGKQPVAQ